MENNNQQSFWQFSDQLRLQTSSLDNLSLNSSIWSNNNYATNTKRTNQRRNFDVNSFTEFNPSSSSSSSTKSSDLSFFSVPHIHQNTAFGDLNGGFNKGSYSNSTTPSYVNNNSNMINLKGHKAGFVDFQQTKSGRKNTNTNDVAKNATDKKLKTLPPSESLPRQESVGGYIFVCNNDTMAENLKRQLFGLPPRYRDSVRAITPGLPLFLYNYSTHQLHGIFEAASFGGNNIDPTAWEDKKCSGESRFPAQVKVINRKICEPLEEDSFRPILHHYDGPKFRLELSVAEAMSLLDIFADQNSFDDIFKAIPA